MVDAGSAEVNCFVEERTVCPVITLNTGETKKQTIFSRAARTLFASPLRIVEIDEIHDLVTVRRTKIRYSGSQSFEAAQKVILRADHADQVFTRLTLAIDADIAR